MAEVYLEGEESVSSRSRDVAVSLQRDKGKGHTSGVVKAYDGGQGAEQRSLTEGHMSRDDVLRQMQSEIAYLRKCVNRKKRRRKGNASSSSDSSEANPGGIHPPMFEPTRSVTHASVSSGVGAKPQKETRMPGTDGIYRDDGSDAMGKALRQIAKSPFVAKINRAKLPRRFSQPIFTMYNGRTDPVEHAAIDMRQLMDRIDKYKRVEEDQMQSKGKMKGYLERKDLRVGGFQGIRPRRDFTSHPKTAESPIVNSLFKEPVHHILEKIRHEPYFRPPNKMSGDASTRNQNLHCHYHQDKGHTTEKCRTLRDHLNQLIRPGKINHLLAKPNGNQEQLDTQKYWGQSPQPSLGTINVILTQPRGDYGKPSRVMTVQNKCGNEDVEENHQTNKRMRSSATPILGFSDKDKEGTFQPHDDALVVTVRIGGYDVKRVLVDDGSGAEIMYPDLFNGLKLKEEDLEKYDHPLVGFDGNQVIPRGMIRLPVQVEGSEVQVNFIVVMTYSPYMAILARPWLHAMEAVSSTLHVMVKYPIRGSVGVLHGSQMQLKEVAREVGLGEGEGSAEQLTKVIIGEDEEKNFQVGSKLPVQEREELIQFLRDNMDVFAWTTYDVPGIDPEVICHHLNINPHATPRQQPPRRASQEHAEAVKEEVGKLKQAGAIKEIFYPEWLANTVVVKKKNGKWRVCVDFTDLNKLGRNMEAYIDDMVIKSKRTEDHLTDLQETFSVLRKYKLRLNASKCSFGVGSGKFLGYMITHRGIEVNPDQIKAVLDLHPPQNPKEVQKLAGMIAALNRFISRSADRCRPFYRLLHKWKDFRWTNECNLAFEDLKQYLSRPPILSTPEKEEVLYAYLAVTNHSVSLVLIRNDDGVQKPIYYVSKSLQEVEQRYLLLKKALLAVVHATRKLPHYFQAHTVVILTQLPLQAIMRKSDYTGRVAKWGTKLGAYDIKYMPRTAIKGQILADFVAEFTEGQINHEGTMMTVMSIGLENVTPWEVYTDGASNRRGAGVGVVLISPEKLVIEKSLRLGFPATNNEAEYEALLVGCQMVKHLGGKVVRLYCDSRLVVGQVNGEFEAKDERMKGYLKRVQGVLGLFDSFKVQQVPRGHNSHADSLAMLATSLGSELPRMVMVEDLLTSSLTNVSAVRVHSVHVGPSWMDPIVTFLQHGILPEDITVAEKVRRSAPRYWLSEEKKLYRRSYIGPYLLCVHPEAVEPLLEELHEGNGQAEATNKVILAGLKKRLDDAKGGWVEELPHVLWAYRTTPRRSTGETPFSMTYGMEAVIPLESGFPTLKSDQYNEVSNHEKIYDCLNTIEERREVASVKMGSYQQKLKQAYDKGVRSRPLVPGDLVLRKVVGVARNPAWGKLGPNWEGPYRITSVAGIGAYRLEDLDGGVVPRPWNVNNLRRYYY
ncbi:uncharacterized protein LOC142612035 [Castanea sativa]|uniref:uncharacterized protein LOC142612035 n=1 Tax=Castanea sativa TaxID=21020 RepID=UPI003F6534B1